MTNLPEFFQNTDLRLIIFGGKGGVGKTTMAATAAIHLARSYNNDKKVLIISTDPAHSLSDSFVIEIGDRVTAIDYSPASKDRRTSDIGHWTLDFGHPTSDNSNLFARELDAKKLLDGFKQKNDAVIKKLAERGTYFDQQDITDFFNLSLPGMDEVMAIIEIADLLGKGTYDILIVDTAPTGHTVRMLTLPEQMLKWVEVMDLMQQKHRYMAVHFTGKKYVKDECDIFLEDLSSDIDRVKKMLSNRETTRFVPVTIPETMSTYETKRLISSLEKMNVPMKEIIVNRVADKNGCAFCASRREDQRQPLSEIKEVFSQYNLIEVPLFPNEIRGIKELKGLADYLLGVRMPARPPTTIQPDAEPQFRLALNPDLEFVFFGGKGGVGKTSLASAASIHLAQRNPEKKILVFSTDPAHSLSDSFGIEIGDWVTPIQWSVPARQHSRSGEAGGVSGQWSVVRGQTSDIGHRTLDLGHRPSVFGHRTMDSPNLFALEIEADRLFEDFKEEFKKDIEEVFDKFLGGGVDIKFDREVMTELLTLAPPGLDEAMALDTIMNLREEGRFDIFVLDTSPTGHLLRFLELPDMVREWLRAFFRLLLKYKGVVRLAKAAEKALALSKNVRRIQEALVDSQRTAFVAVTIPEAMGLLELERLVNALDNARIPCNHILINMVIPQMDCGFCSSKRVEQQGYIKKIRSKFSGHNVTELPLFPREVRGIDDLNKMAEIM